MKLIHISGLILCLGTILYCFFKNPWILILSGFAALFPGEALRAGIGEDVEAFCILALILFFFAFGVAMTIKQNVNKALETKENK